MGFKHKAMIWIITFGVIFVFRVPIFAHFGLEAPEFDLGSKVKEVALPVSDNSDEEQAGTPQQLPQYALVKNNGTTIFREKGRKPFATVNSQQQVTILDEEDTGQMYITVRHNGMAGYISRKDLIFEQ